MTASAEGQGTAGAVAPPAAACPSWCVNSHGDHGGEEDWVHTGDLLNLADGVDAHGCMSVDPVTGAVDGPFVIIGWRQYTPEQAEALARSLLDMARRVGAVNPPAGS